MREVDLAIIGAGVAGLTAAAAAAKQGIGVLVVERMGAGGQVMNVERVDGMPGFDDGISGFELGPELQERAEAAGAEFMLDNVVSIRPAPAEGAARILIEGESESVSARAVLIASGSRRRKLGVPGEERLEGRGVSHCASCDGPLFRGEKVCVVGGGDSAFSEAVVLAGHAGRVSIAFRESAPHAAQALQDHVAQLPNVELVPGATVVAITGETGVSGISIQQGGQEREISAQGVFVYAGLEAETGFLDAAVRRDPDGRIETDGRLATSVPGIFAAGDIRSGCEYLLASAAGDGEAAANSLCEFLRSQTCST